MHRRAHIHQHANIGEKIADQVANGMGSWGFIIGQAAFLALWFVLNTVGWFFHWDSYPFILANLFMSAEAAFASPLILMSQNRQAARDRKRDDLESEEVQGIYDGHQLLLKINQQQLDILGQQTEMLELLKQTQLRGGIRATNATLSSKRSTNS